MARPMSGIISHAALNGVGLFSITLSAEHETVWSRTPRPDPGWSSTDARGHFHAYDSDGSLPTLKASDNPIPCDGSCRNWDCDGYTERVYRCSLCDEPVVPRTVERDHPEVAGTTYTATVSGPVELFDVLAPDDSLSLSWPGGFALVHPTGDMTVSDGDGVVQATLRLLGRPHTRLGSVSTPLVPRRADIDAAVTAAAAALDTKAVDFARLVADAAIRAALPHLGIDDEGMPLS